MLLVVLALWRTSSTVPGHHANYFRMLCQVEAEVMLPANDHSRQNIGKVVDQFHGLGRICIVPDGVVAPALHFARSNDLKATVRAVALMPAATVTIVQQTLVPTSVAIG